MAPARRRQSVDGLDIFAVVDYATSVVHILGRAPFVPDSAVTGDHGPIVGGQQGSTVAQCGAEVRGAAGAVSVDAVTCSDCFMP